MNKYETTINTLNQLYDKICRGHWKDIEIYEDEDSRYTIAIEKAIKELKCCCDDTDN